MPERPSQLGVGVRAGRLTHTVTYDKATDCWRLTSGVEGISIETTARLPRSDAATLRAWLAKYLPAVTASTLAARLDRQPPAGSGWQVTSARARQRASATAGAGEVRAWLQRWGHHFPGIR